MEINLDEEFWTSKYNNQTTGWDLGEISTPLKEYFDQMEDKKLKILIPGAGNSYEAQYLHSMGFDNLKVVDLAKPPLENLKKRCADFPSEHLLQKDFFKLDEQFDLIIEQTFFCALNPKLRKRYAEKMFELLKHNGKLVGVLFNIPLNTDHPPFGGNKEEYLPYFESHFNIETFEECYNSIGPRMGNELFIKLVKKS